MSMKTISSLKSKAVEFESRHRVIPKAMGACLALSTVGVNALAAEGDSGINYTEIANSLKSGFNEVITNCISIATAIIPLAIGLWGLSIMIGCAKRFFTKFAGN
ncbi:MAG: hypothetical protein NC078_04985 [Ruminococcus sp.]|nr:hypothetical protein [Ruminococcus sp.]